ncbi:hydantoinase B/oxoprolinase family protein [Rhodobium gokarnense]|uniref:N-methylhydantoinase B n=1 Tax=Rhodobium gokarnense TaxID=364296 RepID=A0ABT3H625_9HYPH|nr:hydantoinase B/oxoprolinase family protein [Rhodobium gokarnense]MCW2305831.1 N-methylhydantoinase B [Rhodobium gokarnense]
MSAAETTAATPPASIDPIMTEVIYNQVLGAAEEMGTALARTAYSPNIKQRFDFSTAVIGLDGEVLAQAPRIPIHLGSMIGSVRELVRTRPLETLRPGDMFLANDPYNGGGQHLPDINVMAPVFFDDEPVAFVANIAHHADVGGMLAGSEAIACKTIFQEGIRFPTVQVMREGEIVEDILSIVALNSRTPDERRGDLLAQIAANQVGSRRVKECVAKFGAAATLGALTSYMNATETRFRSVLADIPDGTATVEDFLDPDVYAPERPVPIRLTLEKRGTDIFLDFAGSAEQLQSARNVPLGALHSTIYSVLKMLLDPGLAANSGYFRAIHISSPEGSVLNPNVGAAVGARALPCAVIGDVVARAISELVPERALSGCGPHHQIIFSGEREQPGQFWVNYETYAGALGARPYKDGTDAIRVHASGSSNLPVEALEQSYPLLIEEYALNPASAGEGQYRGGAGIIRSYRALADMRVTLAAERQTVPAKGLAGGEDGQPGTFILNPGTTGEEILYSALGEREIRAGEVISVQTPGAGGYGPKTARVSATKAGARPGRDT